jgi:trk system potassium uptake protein TrkA
MPLYIVIVGCGQLGGYLAGRLSQQGHSVVVVDRDDAAFAGLPAEFSGFRVEGDATEMEVLRRAKIDQADFVIAATREDNVNLMVAQFAGTVFGVRRVMARVFDPARMETYREFGIETICPTMLAADRLLESIDGSVERGRTGGKE